MCHIVAHEFGHLLNRTHAADGIMKPGVDTFGVRGCPQYANYTGTYFTPTSPAAAPSPVVRVKGYKATSKKRKRCAATSRRASTGAASTGSASAVSTGCAEKHPMSPPRGVAYRLAPVEYVGTATGGLRPACLSWASLRGLETTFHEQAPVGFTLARRSREGASR